jgi:hypothetical protein
VVPDPARFIELMRERWFSRYEIVDAGNLILVAFDGGRGGARSWPGKARISAEAGLIAITIESQSAASLDGLRSFVSSEIILTIVGDENFLDWRSTEAAR